MEAKAGWIIRDSNGIYKGSAHAKDYAVHSPLEVECQALLMAKTVNGYASCNILGAEDLDE